MVCCLTRYGMACVFCLWLIMPACGGREAAPTTSDEQPTSVLDLGGADVQVLNKPWTGDFGEIASGKRPYIRALVPMSKTMYLLGRTGSAWYRIRRPARVREDARRRRRRSGPRWRSFHRPRPDDGGSGARPRRHCRRWSDDHRITQGDGRFLRAHDYGHQAGRCDGAGVAGDLHAGRSGGPGSPRSALEQLFRRAHSAQQAIREGREEADRHQARRRAARRRGPARDGGRRDHSDHHRERPDREILAPDV